MALSLTHKSFSPASEESEEEKDEWPNPKYIQLLKRERGKSSQDKEFEVQRFRQKKVYEDKSWIYRSSRRWLKWDRVGFSCDKEIQITGVGYYGCSDAYARVHGCHYDILLEIKNYDREHGVLGTAQAIVSNNGEHFRVNFKHPVAIHAGLKYIIASSCRGPKSFFGKEGEKAVTVDCENCPVTFNFLEAKHSFEATATGVNMGVIPNIFFTFPPNLGTEVEVIVSCEEIGIENQ